MNIKIKKGDTVKVTTGKDKGREGKVERILPKANKVVVAGVNMYKRHMKGNGGELKAGIYDVVRPLAVSKVMLVCPKCKKATKIGIKVEKEEKLRVCKKCGEKI